MAIIGSKLWRAERDARIARASFEAERMVRATDMMRNRYTAYHNSFKNSTRNRLRPGPTATGGAGRAHRDHLTRDTLRRDCQDAYRNNPVAQAMIDRKVELVVGKGQTLQVQSEDPDFNSRAEELFSRWAAACDITGRYHLTDLCEQVVAAWHTDGRAAWLKVRGPGGEGVLQTIEDERLRNPGNRPNSELLTAGVEHDASGRPSRYHIASWRRDGSSLSTETTPFDARHVIDMGNPRCRVANVLAPEPAIASVLDWLEMLDEALESTTHAYRIATLFGFIQFSEDPAGDMAGLRAASQNSGEGGSVNPDDSGEYALQPAMGLHLPTSGRVEQLKPEHPKSGIDAFAWMIVQLVAARLALPIDLTHFVMDRNWSGTRSRLAVAWRGVQAEQRCLNTALARVAKWKLAEWVADGRLWAVPGWDRCHWVNAGMPQLDPAMEIKTQREAIEGRLQTYQGALDELGRGDFDDMVGRIGRELGVLRAAKADPVTIGQPGPGAQAGDQTTQGTPVNAGA